jgi:hypothetical protein
MRVRRSMQSVGIVTAVAAVLGGVPATANAATPKGTIVVQSTTRHMSQSSAGAGAPDASGAFKSFSSPAIYAHRVGTDAAMAGSSKRDTATGGTTIYVGDASDCIGTTVDSGNGTSANPYCSIQDAVNAASGGDVVSIGSGLGYTYGPVTITTSDLTLDAAAGAEISKPCRARTRSRRRERRDRLRPGRIQPFVGRTRDRGIERHRLRFGVRLRR